MKNLRGGFGSLLDLGPLYHDYSFFRFTNRTYSENFLRNQRSKEPVITAYTAWALAKCSATQGAPSFMELFCADAYFAMKAKYLGAGAVVGVDNGRDKHSGYIPEIARRLQIDRMRFVVADIQALPALPQADVVANVGGLYHVRNPREVLEYSYRLCNHYLIVQTVVSLATRDPNYFEAPAPGWTWGNRFSRESFDKLMSEAFGAHIVDRHFNELTPDAKLESRGSVYYLVARDR